MFCSKCGNKLDNSSLFCEKCGERVEMLPAQTSLQYQSKVIVKKNYKPIIITASAIIILIVIITAVFSISNNSIVGRVYGSLAEKEKPHADKYSDGKWYYSVVEFKSEGICIWKHHYEFYYGTYEYVDGEYIIRITGDNWSIPENTVCRATVSGNALVVEPSYSGISSGEYIRIK